MGINNKYPMCCVCANYRCRKYYEDVFLKHPINYIIIYCILEGLCCHCLLHKSYLKICHCKLHCMVILTSYLYLALTVACASHDINASKKKKNANREWPWILQIRTWWTDAYTIGRRSKKISITKKWRWPTWDCGATKTRRIS